MGQIDTAKKMAISGVTDSIKMKSTPLERESKTEVAILLTLSVKTNGEGARAVVSLRKGRKFVFKRLSQKTLTCLGMTQMHVLHVANRREGTD